MSTLTPPIQRALATLFDQADILAEAMTEAQRTVFEAGSDAAVNGAGSDAAAADVIDPLAPDAALNIHLMLAGHTYARALFSNANPADIRTTARALMNLRLDIERTATPTE
jgi:hypothetical protein